MRLTCHAPHPDPRRTGRFCGAPLGQLETPVAFRTTAARLPDGDTGTWIRCRRCGVWNGFARIPLDAIAECA